MVSNLKILQCIRKLWPGQENPDGRTYRHWTDMATKLSLPQVDLTMKWFASLS